MLPSNLGELRSSEFGSDAYRTRTIKDEMRANLICKLQAKQPIFSGIVGYEDTVIPQVVNAIIPAQHDPAWPARPGEEQDPPGYGGFPRRADSRSGRL